MVAIGIALFTAFAKEVFVQGSVYRREVQRGDDATAANVTLAKSMDTLTQEVRRIRERNRDSAA